MTSLTALRTRWAAVGAAVAVTLGAVGIGGLNIASAGISSGDRPVFVAIDGCRLIDTRSDPDFNIGSKSTPFSANQTLTLRAHGSNGTCTGADAIPTDAVGLALNVTPVGATVETYLTVWADGTDPGTSALNPAPGEPPTPNAVNTPLSSTGTFKIRNNVGTVDVIIDIAGYYADHDHDDRYYTEAEADDRFVTDDEADDRYVRQQNQLVLDGAAFSPLFAGSNWQFGNAWEHSTIGGPDCLFADVDLPVGTEIDAMRVHYGADSPINVEVSLSEAASGPESASGPAQRNITDYFGPVAVATGASIGTLDVPLSSASPILRLGFSQTVFVCVTDDFTLGSVRIDYTAR